MAARSMNVEYNLIRKRQILALPLLLLDIRMRLNCIFVHGQRCSLKKKYWKGLCPREQLPAAVPTWLRECESIAIPMSAQPTAAESWPIFGLVPGVLTRAPYTKFDLVLLFLDFLFLIFFTFTSFLYHLFVFSFSFLYLLSVIYIFRF